MDYLEEYYREIAYIEAEREHETKKLLKTFRHGDRYFIRTNKSFRERMSQFRMFISTKVFGKSGY